MQFSIGVVHNNTGEQPLISLDCTDCHYGSKSKWYLCKLHQASSLASEEWVDEHQLTVPSMLYLWMSLPPLNALLFSHHISQSESE